MTATLVRPWVAVTRDYDDHELFAREPLTEREAFQFMFRRYARAFDEQTEGGLKRGEFFADNATLARRWNRDAMVYDAKGRRTEAWTRFRVRSFIERLVEAKMIEVEDVPGERYKRRFRVLNYEKYQPDPGSISPHAPSTRSARAPHAEQQSIPEVTTPPDTRSARAPHALRTHRETTSSDTWPEKKGIPETITPPPPTTLGGAGLPDLPDLFEEEEGREEHPDEGHDDPVVDEFNWHRHRVADLSTDPADPWVQFSVPPTPYFRELLKAWGFTLLKGRSRNSFGDRCPASTRFTWQAASPATAARCLAVVRRLAADVDGVREVEAVDEVEASTHEPQRIPWGERLAAELRDRAQNRAVDEAERSALEEAADELEGMGDDVPMHVMTNLEWAIAEMAKERRTA